MIKIICKFCKKEFEVHLYRKYTAIYCSGKCRSKNSKTIFKLGHPQYNTGKTHFKKGHKLSQKHIHTLKQLGRARCQLPTFKNTGKTWFQKGVKHPNWQGGQFSDTKGYVWIKTQSHPRINRYGYVKRSDIVLEKKIGRFLRKGEIAHHINKIKNDDTPNNLMLFSNNSEHMRYHRTSC